MGEVRQFIYPIPDHLKSHKRDSDIVLTKDQATQVVNELGLKVQQAPSYEGKLKRLLKKGFRIISCGCSLYHTIDLAKVKLHKPGGPGGKVVL